MAGPEPATQTRQRHESAMREHPLDRRFFLHMSAAAGMTLAAPARVFAQPQTSAISPEMTALSNYMSAAGTRALPPKVAEQAKHHLLDTLASAISGSELAPGQAAMRYIRAAYSGKGSSTILASMLSASPVDAALANGLLAQADETDDSHNASRSHPGCSVVPAALALGEQLGIDGNRFLRSVTLGYDVGTRVVMAMSGAAFSYESNLATHSIAGTFGAAAAAACAARPRCPPDALGPRLRGAAILRHRRLAARHRPHREVVRLRRHARPQWRHRRARRALGLERRR
jgi:hypothetical protein